MLKTISSFALAGCALLHGVAQARYIGPWLVKEARTGFTAAEYSKTQKCEIFADKTILTTNFGGSGRLISIETKNQSLDGSLTELLQRASIAKLVNQAGAVDGPSIKSYGFLINADDSLSKVDLYDENGGSGRILSNQSSEALILRNVIESLCPNTLQGIGPNY